MVHLSQLMSLRVCVCVCVCVCVRAHARSVVTDALQPHELQPTRLHCPWNFPGKILEWVAMAFSRDRPDPGIKPRSPALQADSLPLAPLGKLYLHGHLITISMCVPLLSTVGTDSL